MLVCTTSLKKEAGLGACNQTRPWRSEDTGYKLDEDKKNDKDRDKDRHSSRRHDEDRDREAHRRRDEERDRERERERARGREEREKRDREREREREQREKERELRDKERSTLQKSRSRTRERSRESRARDSRARDSRTRDDREIEDEEEAHERRRMERRLREKEQAYQELLKRWETRERKKAQEYEKIEERETERKREEAKEARRLKEFLQDYDDDRDDIKYYKSSALQRRLNEREKEMEGDERDRMKEREELEEIRRRLVEDGHQDVDAEMARIEREREEHLMPRLITQSSPDGRRSESSGASPISPRSDDVIPLDDDDDIVYNNGAWNSGGVTAAPSVTQPPLASDRSPYSSPGTSPCRPATRQHQAVSSSSVGGEPAPQRSVAPSLSMSDDSASEFSLGASALEGSAVPGPVLPPSAATSSATSKSRLGFSGLKLGEPQPSTATYSPSDAQKRKKLSVVDVFNNDEDDDSSAASKRRKLIPLTYSEEERAAIQLTGAEAAAARAAALPLNKPTPAEVAAARAAALNPNNKPTSAEEKRKSIKSLIEKIPTAKDELFAYQMDWAMVDTTLMDRRIKPWVNKKIVEYIGEDEPTLSEFICKKVMANSSPQTILSDISMVLDEEAEVFVVKMWRLLIYETEAKKLGLVK